MSTTTTEKPRSDHGPGQGRAVSEEQVVEQVATTIGDSPAAATVTPQEALRWFEIVEVPEAGFRAFARLPNDFQHKDIREKAMAAKARRIRALKNPATDAWEVLDFEIGAIAETEGAVENLVFELLMERSDRDQLRAVEEVNQREEWEHVQQDHERFRSLREVPDDERAEEEYRELVEHLAKYGHAIQEEVDKIQQPRREALTNLGLDTLLDKVRERRIDAEGRREMNDTWVFWQTFVGTLVIPEGFDPDNITMETMPRERFFKEEKDLRELDPLIAVRLAESFDRLEGALVAMSSGNS